MIYIVDASVAVKWFVKENLHDQALRLLDTAGLLQAPDLIVPEVANIVWKKSIRGEVTKDQARVVAVAIRQFIPRLHSIAELTEQALGIALTLNHPVYDCLYLACADVADGVLITADKRLHDAVQDTDFSRLVRYLGDPDFMEGENEALPPLEIPLSKVERVIREAARLLKTNVFLDETFPETGLAGLPRKEKEDLFFMYMDSPSRRRLVSNIDNLPLNERADLLALMRLGAGEHAEWRTLRQQAVQDARSSTGSAMSLNSQLAEHLRRGLASLRRRY